MVGEAQTTTRDERSSTGVEGVDAVLGGGLPPERLYLVHGSPGVGKTTLALQFLLAGRDAGEKGLYVGLSETEDEIHAIARSHGWTLEGIETCDLQIAPAPAEDEAEYTFFHPSEIELTDMTRMIRETLDRVRPRRVVFDSLSELRLMARDSLRYRRQILSLKEYVAEQGATILLLDTQLARGSGEFQLETLAHGVVAMEQDSPGYGGTRRRFRVDKMRGSPFHQGYHDFTIETGGIRAFPRLRPDQNGDGHAEAPLEVFASGIPELDRLCGGGLDRGTTTMVVGPAGVGKSSLTTRLCLSCLEQGEAVAVFHFDEGIRKWHQRARWLDADFDGALYRGQLHLQQVNPAELSPGAFANTIRNAVDDKGVSMVVIDSINGYRSSMVEESFLTLHLHELFRFLNDRDVVTLVVAAQHGFVGQGVADAFRLSYLADNVIVMRYFEAFGQLRKAIALVKKRTGEHEKLIRELHLGDEGLRLGKQLREFQGILGGELVYSGREERLIGEPDGGG